MLQNNKIISLVVCSLLLTSVFIDSIECRHKTTTRHGGGSRTTSTPTPSSAYQPHNEPPPAYVQQPAPVNTGYQQHGYNAPPPSYNTQPGYQQQPVGSNVGTNVAIGGTALLAGVGTGLAGAALYNTLKSDSDEPKTTNGEPAAVHNATQPAASLQYPGLVLDPATNTVINCTEIMIMANQHNIQFVAIESTAASTTNTTTIAAPMHNETASDSNNGNSTSPSAPLAPIPTTIQPDTVVPLISTSANTQQPPVPPQIPTVCFSQNQAATNSNQQISNFGTKIECSFISLLVPFLFSITLKM